MKYQMHSGPLTGQARLTISVDEFCRLAGVGKTYTWSLIAQKKLAVTRVGRRTLISYSSAIKLLAPELYETYLAALASVAPACPTPSMLKGAE